MIKELLCIFIVVVIIIIIFLLKRKKRFSAIIDTLPPCGMNNNVSLAENTFMQIKEPTQMERFRMGQIYLYNHEDKTRAREQFTHILADNDDLTQEEALFIMEGIIDANRYLDAPIPIEDMQMPVSDRGQWQKDNQNVHDALIISQMRDQLSIVRESNKLHGLIPYDYQDIKSWCLETSKNPSVRNVFNILDQNVHLSHLGTNEHDYLSVLWTRFTDPLNSANFTKLRDSFLDCVIMCEEFEVVSCGIGRPPKLWSSLATLDFDASMGQFKSKQVFRHGYYEDANKISETLFLNADKDTLNDYNNNAVTSDKYLAFKANYKNSLLKLREKYNMLDGQILDAVETDCFNSVFFNN